ncbi:peroxiredoxin [Ligilactobacillus salitolerans]|uniref:Peroxiredoxin n=1 Tax=Ligilactobacillus salitolerans TaxID=1808352 RepID=A0A401ITI1_9LACO|nr:OsmC family protein [Ligilactobacillus salitolerans]GBG94828.1 peroxiredoxin [Ligilactobacillus salitolerans]
MTENVKTITLTANDGNFELQQETANWTLRADQGYSPVQMLASAAAACGGYVYQEVLENSKVPFEMKKAEVAYTRDEVDNKAHPLKEIELTFYLQVPADLQKKATSCLRLINRNCPVVQSLDPKITISEKAVFVD